MRKMIKLMSMLLLAVAAMQVVSCKQKNMKTKFQWRAGWAGPKKYPAELFNGFFVYPGEGGCGMRSGTNAIGWGLKGTLAGGDEDMPIPEGLYVKWYSFAESKFWEGSFELPREEMIVLFNEGFNRVRHKTPTTYNQFRVGLAPGGVVVVWITGPGRQVEIGRYQCEETHIPVEELFRGTNFLSEKTRKEHPDLMAHYRKLALTDSGSLEDIEQNGIPFGKWDDYRERFMLRPVIVYEDSTCITDEIYMEYYNGEKESLSLGSLNDNVFSSRPRVSFVSCYWSFGDTYKEMEMEFDEQEIFEAYEQVYAGDNSRPAELQLLLNEKNNHFRVLLVSCDKEHPNRIELKRSNIKIYPLPDKSGMRVFETYKAKNKD